MPVPANPPESLLNLNFGDLKDELSKVIHSAETAIEFTEKWAFFMPATIRTTLDEFLKVLHWLDAFLDKVP